MSLEQIIRQSSGVLPNDAHYQVVNIAQHYYLARIMKTTLVSKVYGGFIPDVDTIVLIGYMGRNGKKVNPLHPNDRLRRYYLSDPTYIYNPLILETLSCQGFDVSSWEFQYRRRSYSKLLDRIVE